MKVRCSLLRGSVVIVALCSVAVRAGTEEAAQKFSEGQRVLAQADFKEALTAYKAACKADPKSEVYRQAATVLQRVIKLRKGLERLSDAEWVLDADALLSFYLDNGVYSEALPLARELHTKLTSAESAVRLARTQIALDQNAAAAEVLQGVKADERTPEGRVLLSLSLTRQGELEGAKSAIADLKLPENSDGALLFDLACTQARLGQKVDALGTLTLSFEQTPGGQLVAAKARAKTSADLGGLRADGGFAKVLSTESKVAESKCSMGESCGKCPSQSKCSAAKKDGEKPAADSKAGCDMNGHKSE